MEQLQQSLGFLFFLLLTQLGFSLVPMSVGDVYVDVDVNVDVCMCVYVYLSHKKVSPLFPICEGAIVDPETLERKAVDQEGELLVKSSLIMKVRNNQKKNSKSTQNNIILIILGIL